MSQWCHEVHFVMETVFLSITLGSGGSQITVLLFLTHLYSSLEKVKLLFLLTFKILIWTITWHKSVGTNLGIKTIHRVLFFFFIKISDSPVCWWILAGQKGFLKHNGDEMYKVKVNLPLRQQNLQGQKGERCLYIERQDGKKCTAEQNSILPIQI